MSRVSRLVNGRLCLTLYPSKKAPYLEQAFLCSNEARHTFHLAYLRGVKSLDIISHLTLVYYSKKDAV
jgi:hypothetical protein